MKSDSNSKSQSNNICRACASYYNPANKKWESGTFTLNKKHIQFVNTDAEQFHLCLPLSTITGIEKRQSNLIYPALVICVGAEKHWFGSFTSRDAVYNILELFWRESLLLKTHKEPISRKNISNTSLGKELLGILHESENTLIETANALSDQNRQLSEAEQDVLDLNSDIVKAEEAIESLSSPLTLPLFSKDKDTSAESEKRLQKYKVTFSFSNCEDKVDWEKGMLIITNKLILLKVDEKVIMQVTKEELEKFEVLSPWELCITHTFSGIQKSCFLMCPQLSRLLKFVSSMSHYKSKISYTDDDSSAYETASCSSRSSTGSTRSSPTSPSTQSTSTISPELNESLTNALSDEEIEELNSILQNLQNLASEIGREQENQLERISSLSENMEATDLRMKKANELAKK